MPPRSKPTHSTAVFLGPSLPLAAAQEMLPADYFPPAARGDIYRIIASGVRTIVLIDGFFHGTRSVWQREILDALGEGIEVFGASSMGALRAAELNAFGMVGHGTIFEWYRDGLIDGDDEVALLHGPEELEFCALSEPLVNIRKTLQQAVFDRRMTDDQARQLLDYAKRTHYPERSYRHLLTCPALLGWPDREGIEQYILTGAVDQKRLDAIEVLRRCAEGQEAGTPVAVKPEDHAPDIWRLERLSLTGFFCGSETFSGNDVLSEAAKEPALVAELQAVLIARAFVMDLVRGKQLTVPDHVLDSYTRRWEKALDIAPGPDWLCANGLTYRSYRRLLAQHFLIDWLIDQDASPPPANGESDDGALIVRIPQRRLLADWARENGVACPPDVPEKHADETDASGDSAADRALTAWIMEKGPRYFGLDWCFESTLLEELQITGLAARLMAKARNT